jgi:hypothetical protein
LIRIAGVTDKSEVVLLLGALGGAKQLHTHSAGVEIDGTLQIADAQCIAVGRLCASSASHAVDSRCCVRA